MFRYGALLLIAAALTVSDVSASAQTCRISSGVDSQGCRSYKEVYEYDYVSDKPSFPGGETRLMGYINEVRHYPSNAYRKGIQGRVMCSFVINTDGSVSNVKVIKGVEKSLNAEAVRIFSGMPAWTPGKIDGVVVPVRVFYTVPFRK